MPLNVMLVSGIIIIIIIIEFTCTLSGDRGNWIIAGVWQLHAKGN